MAAHDHPAHDPSVTDDVHSLWWELEYAELTPDRWIVRPAGPAEARFATEGLLPDAF